MERQHFKHHGRLHALAPTSLLVRIGQASQTFRGESLAPREDLLAVSTRCEAVLQREFGLAQQIPHALAQCCMLAVQDLAQRLNIDDRVGLIERRLVAHPGQQARHFDRRDSDDGLDLRDRRADLARHVSCLPAISHCLQQRTHLTPLRRTLGPQPGCDELLGFRRGQKLLRQLVLEGLNLFRGKLPVRPRDVQEGQERLNRRMLGNVLRSV